MFCLRKLFVLLFLVKTFEFSEEWIPFSSPQTFQTYMRQFKIMKTPVTQKYFQVFPNVDFTQPKIQSFYKASLLQEQAPVQKYLQVVPNVDFTQPKTQTFYKASLLQEQAPVYEFKYKVHDPKENNYQEKSEIRTGDSVKGYYTVREPNGYIRLVRYVSDENGFQTQVSHHYAGDNEEGNLKGLKHYYT